MTKNTHVIIGTLASISFLESPLGLLGLYGTIAPDLDIKISKRYHRVITHSLVFLGLTSGILYGFNHEIGIIWFISYLSHLVLDSFTKSGIPLLYPIKKRYGLRFCTTGLFIDKMVGFFGWVALCVVVVNLWIDYLNRYWNDILSLFMWLRCFIF